MTEQSAGKSSQGRVLVSQGQQMTEQMQSSAAKSDKKRDSNKDNFGDINYNSRMNFLRGEATMEHVPT